MICYFSYLPYLYFAHIFVYIILLCFMMMMSNDDDDDGKLSGSLTMSCSLTPFFLPITLYRLCGDCAPNISTCCAEWRASKFAIDLESFPRP
jgi:hypothetical protein